MKKEYMTMLGVIIAGGICLSGCAVGRGQISLSAPSPTARIEGTGKAVSVNQVLDSREFHEAPKDPSIPSLDGGLSATPKSKWPMAIGRKRNSFGQTLGDIFLQDGQTVETLILQTIQGSFLARGYKVARESGGDRMDEVQVNAKINNFWAWMTPGFTAITLECKIATEITARQGGREDSFAVNGNSKKEFMAAATSQWMQTYQSALNDYQGNLEEAIRKWEEKQR